MDNYTLNLYKSTNLNIYTQKSEAIISDDDSKSTILRLFLLKTVVKCKHCDSFNIHICSSIGNNMNYALFTNHKVTIKLNRRKYHCRDCDKYLT